MCFELHTKPQVILYSYSEVHVITTEMDMCQLSQHDPPDAEPNPATVYQSC